MKNRNKIIISIAFCGAGFLVAFFLTSDSFHTQRMGIVRAYNTAFYFVQNQTAQVSDSLSKNVTQISVPFYRQKHALTCETAALKMALNYYGIKVTEDELIKKLTFATKNPRGPDNIWGDHDLGFVGDIDGSIFDGTGYGVYHKPIYDLAAEYRPSYIMQNAELSEVLEEVKNGNPVVVWGLLSKSKPIIWQTENGKQVEGYPGEHARVVTGFYGTVKNPGAIILMDPIYGKVRIPKNKFLADWKVMNNRTVVIY